MTEFLQTQHPLTRAVVHTLCKKPKIEKKLKFSNNESYFSSDFHIKCDTFDCRPDTDFENYIRDIIKPIHDKEKLEEADNLLLGGPPKEWIENRNILITNYNYKDETDETTETDITQKYKYYISNDLLKIYYPNIIFDTTNNYFEFNNSTSKLKIFLIKIKNKIKKHFKFLLIKNDSSQTLKYYDKDLQEVNDDGEESIVYNYDD